jgi:hypothetical protein
LGRALLHDGDAPPDVILIGWVSNRPARIDDRQLKILARSITGVCHGHSGVGRFDGFLLFFTI